MDLTNALGTAVLIWYGASLIQNEADTIGVFVSFAFYLGMFWEPISRLGQVYNQLLMGMSHQSESLSFWMKNRSFARVLSANPKILIMDKATASIDKESEMNSKCAVTLLKGRTAIIIAHRLSAIRETEYLCLKMSWAERGGITIT